MDGNGGLKLQKIGGPVGSWQTKPFSVPLTEWLIFGVVTEGRMEVEHSKLYY